MEITQRVKARLKQVQDWNQIPDELVAEIEQIGDATAKSKAHYELAQGCELYLQDRAHAMESYQAAFKLDRSNIEALEGARRIYHEMAHLEMEQGLLKLHQRLAPSASTQAELGRALLDLRQTDDAIIQIREAHESDPDNVRAADLAEQVNYDRAEWKTELEMIVDEIKQRCGVDDPAAAETAGKGTEVARLYLRAARILQQEEPSSELLPPYLFKALDADPLNEDAGYLAELQLVERGHSQFVQRLQDRRVAAVHDVSQRATLLQQFASVWLVRFNNPEVSAYFARKAMELIYGDGSVEVPSDHIATFRLLVANAESAGGADTLVSLAQRGLAKLKKHEDRGLLALEAAGLAQYMGADDAVVDALMELVDAHEHPVYLAWQRTQGSAQAAEQQAAATASGGSAGTNTSAAEPKRPRSVTPAANRAAPAPAVESVEFDRSELGDEAYSDEEIELLKQAHGAAAKGDRRAIDAWRDAMAKLPGRAYPRRQLRAIYEAAGKWSNVADLIKEQIKTDPEHEHAALHWELVELYRDELKQHGLVIHHLSALEKIAEDSGDVAERLRVLEAQQIQYTKMKRWAEVISRLRLRSELADNPVERIALKVEAGNLYLEKFSNQAEAIKCFESLLEDDPTNEESITKLKDLYQRRRDWEKLVELQQRELDSVADAGERKERLLEIARTAAAKVKNPSLSIKVWSAVLECDPTNVEALVQLEGLQERERAWPELAATLRTLTEVETDPNQRAAHLVKLGSIYSDKLQENGAAISVWEDLLEIDPNNRRAQDSLRKLYLELGDLEALERFYARQDKWSEFVRVLEREIENREGGERIALILKTARLYTERLERPDRAIRALEKGLEHDDQSLELADALIELYEQAGDERRLVEPLKIKLDATDDGAQRYALQRRLADICERVTKDYASAFEYLRQAFRDDHQRDELVPELVRLGQATTLWKDLVETLEDAWKKFGDVPESIEIRLAAARTYEEYIEDPEAALAIHQSVLDIDPEQVEALEALERLYLQLGREQDLLSILQTKLDMVEGASERAEILGRIGEIQRGLGETDAAIAAFNEILDLDRASSSTLSALDALYVQTQQWDALADILRRELDSELAAQEEQRLELSYRLGETLQQRLGQAESAVELYEQVLFAQNDHAGARAQLEACLDNENARVSASRVLLPIYESGQEWAHVVRCLEIGLEAELDPEKKIQTLSRIGRIQAENLHDRAAAFASYSRAFQQQPSNELARQALEELAAIESWWSQYAELLEAAVKDCVEPELVRNLLTRLATVYDNELRDTAAAVSCYQRRLELDVTDQEALFALEALFLRTEQWDDLLNVYNKQIVLSDDPSQREQLRMKVAQLQEEMLGRPDDAIESYREILNEVEDHPQALAALDRLFAASERWHDLAQVLERQLERAEHDSAVIQLSLRLGKVHSDKLNQSGLAVELYGRVIELDNGNEAAVAELERLLEDPEQQLDVARRLEPLYRSLAEWEKLVGVLGIMVERSLDPSEKRELLIQIADIHATLDNLPAAFEATGRAFIEVPADEDCQYRLVQLAEQLGAHAQLVKLFRGVSEDVVDETLKIDLLKKIANLYDVRLEASDRAAEVYEQILEINPEDIEAVDELIQVHHRANRFEALIDAVRRKVEMIGDPEEQRDLLIYAADIYKINLEQPEKAVELYQQVLTVDPSNADALDSLETIYDTNCNWEALKDIYSRRLELSADPEYRLKILKRLGQLYDREVGDIDRAIDTYQNLLDLAPDDLDAIQALDRLYEAAKRPLDQLQVLERAVEHSSVPEEATELRYRIGRLWQDELGDASRAVEAFSEVLLHQPEHQRSLEALDEIAHSSAEPMAAAEVLKPMYLSTSDWPKLVALYRVMATHADSPDQQVALLHDAADIQTQQLGEIEGAFALYEQALEIDPESPETLARIEQLAATTGEWQRFAQVLGKLSDNILDPTAKVRMLLRIADVERQQLNDVDAAIARFEAVLEADPTNGTAIAALDEIYESQGRWAELIENLQRQIRLSDGEGWVELHFRMAEIYRAHIGDVVRAIDAYREILLVEPEHPQSVAALENIFDAGHSQIEIADILEPIYESAGQWESVVKHCRVRFSALEDPSERLLVIQKVAGICERRLSAPESALHWWLRAYMDDPRNDEVLREVERIATETGMWREVADVAAEILQSEVGQEPTLRIEVMSLLGEILEQRLGDIEPAIGAYREVLALDAENITALDALARMYSGMSMWEDLTEVMQRRIRAELDGERLVALELQLAEVFEQQLSQTDQALAAYHRVLEHDPGNERALDALERVYLAREDWEKLYEVYERKSDVANTQEELARCFQHMAKLCSSLLDRRDDAMEHWNKVLDLQGDDAIPLAELAHLYEEAERWEDAVDALERYTYVQPDLGPKVAAYHDLGRIQGEKLGNERAALDAWIAAHELEPGNPRTLKTLRAIYESNQDWPELAEVLTQLVMLDDASLAPESRRDVFARLGVVQGEYLMASDEAVDAWSQVLLYNEGDAEALDALEKLYESEARWRDVVSVLRQKQAHNADEAEQVEILLKIAQLWEERIEDPASAIEAYEEVLTLDEGHERAADALETIYRDTGNWQELSTLFERRAAAAETAEKQVRYLQQAAHIDETQRGDLDSAFENLQVALQCDYNNEKTAAELERIATATGRWEELLVGYEGQLELPELKDDERCNLLVKLSRWYLERGDPSRALDFLMQAQALDESNLAVQRESARFFRSIDEPERLAETLATLVGLETETERQIATLLELAKVYETELRNGNAAAEAYRSVLAIDGEQIEAMNALAALCESSERWDELVEVLVRIANTFEDPLEQLTVRHRIGQIQELRLEDRAAATSTYREIVAADPGDREALRALERLYLKDGQIDDYLETLEAELDATYDPDEQIQVYEKMAQALIEHANDPLRAAEALENIITKDSSRDDVFRQLEALYSDMERWPEVVETYRSHVESTEDVATRVQLLQAMGDIFEKRIEDPERAKDTYSEILEIDPGNFEAAQKRSQLQEVIEDWQGAVDSMQTLAGMASTSNDRVELLTRSGRILVAHLQDFAQAEERLNEALAIDPTYVPALRELAEVHRQHHDWHRAAKILQSAAECSTDEREAETLAAEAGFIYLEELDDEAKAMDMFARVMESNPGHTRVGLTLATIYFEHSEYENAAPIYGMLAAKMDSLELDNFQQREILYRAAIVARDQGDRARALDYFDRAYQADSADHDVLVGMADLLFEQQEWERAFKLYQTILVQHRDSQSDDDTVLVYYRLGTIKRHQGEARKALNYMEKALEVQPHHRATLEAVIEYQSENGDWDAVIAAKQALCDVAEDPERFRMYREIGDIYANQLGNRRKATEAYEAALEIQPLDFPVLHILLDLHTNSEQWADAIDVIDRIVAVEQDGLRRSRYNYTGAVLMRDHLHALDESVARFNKVLDDDPTMLKAFQAIDTILTRSKEWKELERNYRRMLKRLANESNEPLRLALLDNLGEIYRSRLNQYPEAVATYVLAKKLDPSSVKRRLILGELYQHLIVDRPDEYINDAVKELQELLFFEPHRYETYRSLFEIYRDTNQVDKAFCVASAMIWVGKITKRSMAEEEQFYKRYRPSGIPKARQRLSEEVFRRNVFHPQQDHFLTAIMGIMAKSLAVTRAQIPSASLESGNRIDISTNPAPVAQVAQYIRGVLNVQAPELIVRADAPGDISVLNLKRDDVPIPTLVVMQNMAKRMSDQRAAAFLLGRHLCELYLPHYAYVAVDRSHRKIRDVFWACRRICGLPVAGDMAAIDAEAKRLRPYLSAAEIDGLRDLMKHLEADGRTTDVKGWGGATELTCYRTGLLMCGDLDTALHMVSVEAQNPASPFSATDKAKELLLYSVSEGYFAARQSLGIQVG